MEPWDRKTGTIRNNYYSTTIIEYFFIIIIVIITNEQCTSHKDSDFSFSLKHLFLAKIKWHAFPLYRVHKNHSEDTGRALISWFICNIPSAPRSLLHHGYLRQIVLYKL